MNIGKVSSGKSIAFGGYQKVLDDKGYNKFKFFYPYDSSKYCCEVCLYDIEKEKDSYPVVAKEPRTRILLDEKGSSPLVNIDEIFAQVKNDKFAYRFEFKDRKAVEESLAQGKDASEVAPIYYAFDPGMAINTLNTIDDSQNGREEAYEKNDGKGDGVNNANTKPDNKFNIVIKDRVSVTKDGKMQLIMPDEYYPGVVRSENGELKVDQALRSKALTSVRTHINKLGGTLNGIIMRLPELEKEGFTRIVGTPLTKDTISSHLYWTQNAYQVAPQLGSMGDFRNLNVEMYKHGMNWVADAALVNEGFEGIHLSNVLRWGKQSPFYNWFRINGLDNGSLMMGVLPQNDEHSTYRLVNSPFTLKQDGTTEKNQDYDPKKPTYVQMYDKRMATDEQLKSKNLIMTYDRNNTDNPYDITDHDDVVYPYYFEIDPKKLELNIANYKKSHGDVTDYYSPQALVSLLQFDYYKVDKKAEGGMVSWDGNVDIAKLNFAEGNKDQEITDIKDITPQEKKEMKLAIDRGILEVQDYAILSGRYWTKTVADSIVGYTAQVLGKDVTSPEAAKNAITKAVKEGKLPKATQEKISDEVLKNVFSNSYKLNILSRHSEKADAYMERMLMDTPLETLPFTNNLLGALTSSYIVKRARTEQQLGMSRFDFNKYSKDSIPEEFRATYDKMDAIYKNQFTPVAKEVMAQLGFKEGPNHKFSAHGTYVANDILPEISQYLFVKSLFPEADVRFKAGHVDFSHVDQEACSLNALRIYATSPEDEASKLLKRLSEGASKIGQKEIQELLNAYSPRISKTSEMSYKLADAIVDRTESGMGWRIDAAKDIASIDAVKEQTDTMDKTFEKVISFWKGYNSAVSKVNPHVYTAAEITDLPQDQLFGPTGKGRFMGPENAELKFLQETGITTTANYTYFFSTLPKLVSAAIEDGGTPPDNFNSVGQLKKALVKGWNASAGFLFQLPLDGVLHSYTFVGNHDKPRILHCLALDMALYNSNFTNAKHREIAAEVLGKNIKDINFVEIKPPAIAMGDGLRKAFAKVISGDQLVQVNEAIAKMANGEFKGKKFNPEAFGARSLDIVIDEVLDQAGLKETLSSDNLKAIEAKVLKVMLEPAFDKYYTIYKTLITLPGDPTDFAGDKVGVTGYETKAKNCFQQNRNVIRWEWLDDPQRDYIKKYYNDINSILNLRNRPECSALNDGVPVVLPNVDSMGKKVNPNQLSILRYNDKGSMVVTTYAPQGAPRTPDLMQREDLALEHILINSATADLRQSGLKGGITEGTKFKNANPSDDNTYVVRKSEETGDYYIVNEGGDGRIHIAPEDYNALVLYKVD